MQDLTELLAYIPPGDLDYSEWISVGMALKHEGYPCNVWDDWSASDAGRYKAGNCQKKWDSFKEATINTVTGGSIYALAERFGYQKNEVRVFGWNDTIMDDGDKIIKDMGWVETEMISEPTTTDWNAAGELKRYLELLFRPDEYVGYCVKARKDEKKDKWLPADRGVYGFTQKELIKKLDKHPEDIEAALGDYNREAGAWIHFNPLDGKGVANANVTAFRYALIESDTLDISKQKALIEELKLPVAVMVSSGGKSVHAVIKINALTEREYREKVDYMYAICAKNGLTVDTQNKNPSRMSRMPGIIRGDKKQYIIAENLGLDSFDEWRDYIEDALDELPDIISYAEVADHLPELSEELIEGMLRVGHKMIIAGPSKAGKSFLLINLALSIAQGSKWLGEFPCTKGRVLYLNLEIDSASFLHRVAEVAASNGDLKPTDNLDIWNLRGEQANVDILAPRLIRRAKGKGYKAIIIDPLYKINMGDENSASEMGRFFNQLDKIGKALSCSIISCHHHSKGMQAQKFAIDRASGSGVFARDPDALVDLLQLDPKDSGVSLPEDATAWRMSMTLREFKTPPDTDLIFEYPLHYITEDLKEAEPYAGKTKKDLSEAGNDVKRNRRQKKIERFEWFVLNWDTIKDDDIARTAPLIEDAVKYFKNDKGYSRNSIKGWIDQGLTQVRYERGSLFYDED